MRKCVNIPIFIPHLACKNDCVFCNQKRISGCITPPGREEIEEKTKNIVSTLDTQNTNVEIAFFGGSFTGLERSEMVNYLEIAKELVIKYRLNGIRLSTRPDYISEDILDCLEAYGVTTIELGVQSMADSVLEANKRGHTSKQVEYAVGLIKRRSFTLILQMMTGLLGSDDQLDIYTASRLIDFLCDGVRIYPTVVVKDTQLEQMYYNNSYVAKSVDEAADLCKRLYVMFENAGIPIIRLGLYADESLSKGSVVAGAFHPAFCEIVISKLFLDEVLRLLKGNCAKEVDIYVAPGCISKLRGQKNCNIKFICRRYNINKISVYEDENLKNREIRIESK